MSDTPLTFRTDHELAADLRAAVKPTDSIPGLVVSELPASDGARGAVLPDDLPVLQAELDKLNVEKRVTVPPVVADTSGHATSIKPSAQTGYIPEPKWSDKSICDRRGDQSKGGQSR